MKIWLNGKFVTRDDANVSIFDAGFQHGVGLFETMLARHGRVFRLEPHLQRLGDSAELLLLTKRLRLGPLAEAVELTVAESGLDDARVRLTVTGGDLGAAPAATGRAQDATIAVVVQPATEYPDAFFTDGVVARIADGRENPLHPMSGHKTLNYWPRIQALQSAAAAGAGESLWFTVSNHLASGSVSNVFLVKDEQVLTPFARGEEHSGSLAAPVLPGITRAAVLELAEGMGLETDRRMLDIEQLLASDEVFLTNSSWGVLPVVGVEREQIGDGSVGPITARLLAAWRDLVEAETTA